MSKTRAKRYKSPKIARKARARAKVAMSVWPKLTVFKSNKYVYAQIVDLKLGKSLTGVKGKDPATAGKDIASRAVKLGVREVVFDRGPYKYHGKIKALAESAREGGLKF